MTVAELIACLQTLPADARVVQAIDPEGNGFRATEGVELGRFDGEEYGLFELTEELRAEGFSVEDVPEGPPAVCLWP